MSSQFKKIIAYEVLYLKVPKGLSGNSFLWSLSQQFELRPQNHFVRAFRVYFLVFLVFSFKNLTFPVAPVVFFSPNS